MNPTVGRAGGQEYDVARAIRTFLEQMAAGGIPFGAAVVKELVQNADDAGASELVLALDERSADSLPPECKEGYGALLEPALLVRNNAPFRIAGEVPDGDQDDFAAICDVAGGHKRFNPTAAGRFGIGFNSVYFLTDTPLLFSRREVHVFDLRHLMFAANGWRFTLDDFPAKASTDRSAKPVLDWGLPKSILLEGAFGDLAVQNRDYRQTVFRLPLRRSLATDSSAQSRGPVFPSASFPESTDRISLLHEMCDEARRSLYFLKSLRRVVIGEIVEKRFDEWVRIEARPQPSTGLEEFLRDVRRMRDGSDEPRQREFSFRCGVSLTVTSDRLRVAAGGATFQVTHRVDYANSDLVALADKLKKNDERAVPWVGLATPLDAGSFDWEGRSPATWRVFLPLAEAGPCAAILNAAVFVDPSRRSVEFRSDGSDETLRKSTWNRTLVEKLLVPLLRDRSIGLIDDLGAVIEEEPAKYLSLFPTAGEANKGVDSLSDVVRASFSKQPWLLRLHDVYRERFDLEVGPGGAPFRLERVPEWLSRYRESFRSLGTETRRFVTWRVGEAVADRLGSVGNVQVTRVATDVADRVLSAESPPEPRDLQPLLRMADIGAFGMNGLQGRWALQRDGDDSRPLRFDSGTMYLVRSKTSPPVFEALQRAGVSFEATEWAAPGVGLCSPESNRSIELTNLRVADEAAALEVLRRTASDHQHDSVQDHRKMAPVVDFLCSLSPGRLTDDLRLAFLVKTAPSKLDRRALGVVFLRQETPAPDAEDLWQGLLRAAFAEVDPQFAPQVRRLLAHAPHVAPALRDGRDGCRVRFPEGDLLEVFAEARTRDVGFATRLSERLRRSADGQHESRSQVRRAARLVLHEAARRWETLGPDLRQAVLSLPFHRTAEDELICLAESECVWSDEMAHRFWLQSPDDLRDAPVQLESGVLLHTPDRDLRTFYRTSLGIRERGRVEVLKECLRQVGGPTNHSAGLLRYVADYYRSVVDALRESGAEGAADRRELEALFGGARGVYCLDGSWHRAADCVNVASARSVLEKQGWRGKQLIDLLIRLTYPLAAVDRSSEEARTALGIWKVNEVDVEHTVAAAICGECPELALADRLRVVAMNLHVLPKTPLARAAVLADEAVETLSGTARFRDVVLVEPKKVALRGESVRVLVPNAVDLPRLAGRLVGVDGDVLPVAMRALGVPAVDDGELRSSVVNNFRGIWRPELASSVRLNVLEWLGSTRGDLPPEAKTLDTVLAGDGEGKWMVPTHVIAPSWTRPKLPNVPATRLPRTEGVSPSVLRLWDQWCGVRELGPVVEAVAHDTRARRPEEWPSATKQLFGWLGRIAADGRAEDVGSALRTLPWVLARKGSETAFRASRDVLDHPGAEVLGQEFWVAIEGIPAPLVRIVETLSVGNTREVLGAVARCLSQSASASRAAVESVYALVVELTADEDVRRVWTEIATNTPVYRLFRDVGGGVDTVVTGSELFLGERESAADYGKVLYCFGAGDEKKNVRRLYRKLGVGTTPSADQLVGALSRLPCDASSAATHNALVEALTGAPPEDPDSWDKAALGRMRVRSCAKTFEPLDICYRNGELDRPARLSAACHHRIVSGRDTASGRLIRWLDEHFPGVTLDLTSVAAAELRADPEEDDGGPANVLDAWRDWLSELGDAGSVVRENVEAQGARVPANPVGLFVARRIDVRFLLPDGSYVEPSQAWEGPEFFHDGVDRLFVRSDRVRGEFLGRADDVERLDKRIAEMLEELLRRRGGPLDPPLAAGRILEAIRNTLERPGTILKRMKEQKEEHFFHQYLDQTADPEFSKLFEAYRRLSTASSAMEKRRQMAAEMWNLISLRFVDARRTQIRGHGYDEFAIFAELVQNAEDAYAQRGMLGLPEPPRRGVFFAFTAANGSRSLSVRHYGRPFNLWRYGSNQVDAFRYDVEGVLKSAGSFKPHSRTEGARPIGRFGLGFKSVYLVSDAPRIHSGDWHFEISRGCIPEEIPAPEGYDKQETRIVLPLTAGAREERDGERGRFASLVPFLRFVEGLRFEHTDGKALEIRTTAKRALATSDGHRVDRVEITSSSGTSEDVTRLLRVRHETHEGQLAMLLGEDGLPVPWSDSFEPDVFAALPLRVRLGCGASVSHLFEVQSGRTHLIDPEANLQRIDDVTGCLPSLVKALMVDDAVRGNEAMRAFWLLWRWDRGDDEAAGIRVGMARELVNLSRKLPVVPTLEPGKCVRLGEEVLFSFRALPDFFTEKLLEKQVELGVGTRRTVLQKASVVPSPVRSALDNSFAAAGVREAVPVSTVGWAELGEEFQAHPWLAEHPDLVSAAARSLAPDTFERVRPWLGKCLFLAASGKHDELSRLLPPSFPGKQLLPHRFLNCLDDRYDEAAVELLQRVGLPARPPVSSVKQWVESGLYREECGKLLRFLSEGGRWHWHYFGLGEVLKGRWFDAGGERVSPSVAVSRGQLDLKDLDPSPEFRAWLGIDTGSIVISNLNLDWQGPVSNPRMALANIWEWWSGVRSERVRWYEYRTYPGGRPPRLSRAFSERDSAHRRNWISLLMLGSLHTMGRTKPEQHREFMAMCEKRGWLDVFADPGFPAERWIGVLENYLESQTFDSSYLYWMKQFISFFQIARWLPTYVNSFLDIDRATRRFDLGTVTQPAVNERYSGGGPCGPPLTRTLGIGSCFVVRELVRAGLLEKALAFEHGYVAVGRVRSVFERLGMSGLSGETASYSHSREIHGFLVGHLGSEKAHFHRCFDLPFLEIAEDKALQQRFLECEFPPDEEAG